VQFAYHSIHHSPMMGGATALEDVLDATVAAGFGLIGLDMQAIDAFTAHGATVQDLAERLVALGLRCCDLVVLVVGPHHDEALEAARRMATVARVLGPQHCVTAVDATIDHELLCTLRDVAGIVSDAGGRLAIEYASYVQLSTLRQTVEVCDAIGWDRAAVLLDSFHCFRTSTPYDEIQALDASQIAFVQFSDAHLPPVADVLDDSRNRRLIPGRGDLPLHRFVEVLGRTGFDGIVVPEVLSSAIRSGSPYESAPALQRALDEYWPRVIQARVTQ
jgi:sugar phosphate isomerase/epimerase